MSEQSGKPANLSDPVRLKLLQVLFRLADQEHIRRANGNRATNGFSAGNSPEADDEVTQLTAQLSHHFSGLESSQLNTSRLELARGFLNELDRLIAGSGKLPGDRVDLSRIPPETAAPVPRDARVALVSLPWMSPAMPSIQLATLAAALRENEISCDVHELYVDYAARIGLNLFNHLGNLLGFLPEWIFSRHYYGPETGDDLSGMLDEHLLNDSPWPEYGDDILHALHPVTADYLDRVIDSVDWSRYDIIGCSLTISQLGASMAFARRIKIAHPDITIVCGGSQCAGPMGRAILKVCPYIDLVVQIEGELVLHDLVRYLRDGSDIGQLPGLCFRDAAGDVISSPPGELYRQQGRRVPLNYDAYFQRLQRLQLMDKMNPWLPFEGSRGCWYGQKAQCTFCGLHEIMEFRAWDPDTVLDDLERLEYRYGVGRFYSMDLILPREFYNTLLPEIINRKHNWMIFYEIKSNVRRSEVEMLHAAGVRWVQPGIESLDKELLGLMRKGVSPMQNLQLLKWCEELGIFCGWNMLTGLPGETQESYQRLTELMPKLFHLKPPSGGGQFQLHRFSPYFEDPRRYGIRWTGAHPLFRYAFPVGKELLDELVYLHDFEPCNDTRLADATSTHAAIQTWRRAYQNGATLRLIPQAHGGSEIHDHRQPSDAVRIFELSMAETTLYRYLDESRSIRFLEDRFSEAHPTEMQNLTASGGLNSILAKWLRDDLVLKMDQRFIALAVEPRPETLATAALAGQRVKHEQRAGERVYLS